MHYAIAMADSTQRSKFTIWYGLSDSGAALTLLDGCRFERRADDCMIARSHRRSNVLKPQICLADSWNDRRSQWPLFTIRTCTPQRFCSGYDPHFTIQATVQRSRQGRARDSSSLPYSDGTIVWKRMFLTCSEVARAWLVVFGGCRAPPNCPAASWTWHDMAESGTVFYQRRIGKAMRTGLTLSIWS
jgi:hypothetical protein